MAKRKGAVTFISALAGALALAVSGTAAALEWNFPPAASPISDDIHWLHQFIMLAVVLPIFFLVFGFMFYACYRHRKSKGHPAEQFHENTTVEILWTIIPAVILVVIAWPVTKVVISQKDTSSPDLTIKATGYQWKWGYDYLKGEGEGISFVSMLATPREQIDAGAPKDEHYLLEVDRELVVPVDKKVRVLTTAADVIHAWWVPAFGAKQDAIPGFIRDTWFRADKTGIFRGQCAELCGKEHGFMPIVVRVVSQEDYTKWVAQQKQAASAQAEDPNKKWDPKELVARGEKVYGQICVACHAPQGQGTPAMKAPALAGNKFVVGAKDGPIDTVLNGRPNTAMQAFGKQLSDTEIAAVLTYVRASWGNKAAEVQPAEVKARHK
ncbi:MAG TPA: cytochrome c oxidase subunit II [Burkholderiales bacterium]|nr:cytochrome c oxidase subunit II [Burkholderiales bacterium]